MIEEKPNASKASAVFLASLLVVAINAYLIGKFSTAEFFDPAQFNSFYLFLGLVSGIVITYGFANFVLKEKYREKLLSDAITDPVTGLYTRHYMNEVAPRFIGLHQRDPQAGFALSLIELTADKKDMLQSMRSLATVVMSAIRETDVAIQYNQHQIAIFSTAEDPAKAEIVINRILDEVAAEPVNIGESSIHLSIKSIQALHKKDESMSQLLTRTEDELFLLEWSD